MAARSFAYHAHETADHGRRCYPWLVCHDIKSAMQCSLRLAPTMINHLTSTSLVKHCRIKLLYELKSVQQFNSNLADPDNGQATHIAGTTVGQTATYSCDTGYNLVGNSTRTCQATGEWSGSAPVCEGVYVK